MVALAYFNILEERSPDRKELFKFAANLTDEKISLIKKTIEYNYSPDEVSDIVERASENTDKHTTH